MVRRICGAQQRRGRRWLMMHIQAQCNLCAICNGLMAQKGEPSSVKTQPTLDHIVPRSKGGKHTFANTQAAHSGCNQDKGDKIIPKGVIAWPKREKARESAPPVTSP